MKTCVLLASYIPHGDKLPMGEEVLRHIKTALPQSDLIVGINPSGMHGAWIELVKQYTDMYEVTPRRLLAFSEVSAYQTALRMYKQNLKDYDLVWFLHTLGSTSHYDSIRHEYFHRLLTDMSEVLRIMNYPEIGAYASCLSPTPALNATEPVWHDKIVDRFHKEGHFKYEPFRYITRGAMYVLKGQVLNEILLNTTDELVNETLWVYKDQMEWSDKFFFENYFLDFVSKSGYILFPSSIDNAFPELWLDDLKLHYLDNLEKWLKANGLNTNIIGKMKCAP